MQLVTLILCFQVKSHPKTGAVWASGLPNVNVNQLVHPDFTFYQFHTIILHHFLKANGDTDIVLSGEKPPKYWSCGPLVYLTLTIINQSNDNTVSFPKSKW